MVSARTQSLQSQLLKTSLKRVTSKNRETSLHKETKPTDKLMSSLKSRVRNKRQTNVVESEVVEAMEVAGDAAGSEGTEDMGELDHGADVDWADGVAHTDGATVLGLEATASAVRGTNLGSLVRQRMLGLKLVDKSRAPRNKPSI